MEAQAQTTTQESAPLDLGKPLDAALVQKGLRELCSGLHFDMLTNIGQWHPMQKTRQGVFYDGEHICSMDRGMIPEFKVWDEDMDVVEIPMLDYERYDDAMVMYLEVLKTDPFYEDALAKAEAHDDNYHWDDKKKKVFNYRCVRMMKTKGKVIRVGWRHTFEQLVRANLAGLTRESIGEKFGVDLYKFPAGAPEEIEAALNEE